MHISRREARGQNDDHRRARHLRRFHYARVHRRYHRAAQIFRHDLRQAYRRANDSQISRGRVHARRPLRDESPQAKTHLATPRAPSKWIHPAAVRAQRQRPHPLLETHR
jgi:hypothetical protein